MAGVAGEESSDAQIESADDWLESDDEGQGTGLNDYAMATKDTVKVQSKLYDDGYRAGITSGKEAMIQPGFDYGYNEKGAPAGKKYGFLLGSIDAMESYAAAKMKGTTTFSNELKSLKARVKALKLHDIVERDWEALEHEAEHGADISHIKRENDAEKRQRESRLEEMQSVAEDIMKRMLASP